MKWSKGPPEVFDGGVLGRDRIDVYRPDKMTGHKFRVFAYQDTESGVADMVGPPQPPADPVAPPATAPQPSPSSPSVQEADVTRLEQEAFERGREQAQATADAQLQRVAEQLEGAAQFFHETINKVDRAASRQAFELGLMLAEKLFRRSVQVDPQQLLGAVDELLDAASNDGPLRLVVDPETAKRWRDMEATLQKHLGDRAVSVEAKADLSPGDVIVHCGDQTLDDRIERRVRQYRQAIEHELGLGGED